MKTIVCKFKSCGKNIRKIAILNDTLTSLSKSKKNEADEICEYPEDNFWSLSFSTFNEDGEANKISYEVEFEYEGFCKTLIPRKAITWNNEENGCIEDVQEVNITIK